MHKSEKALLDTAGCKAEKWFEAILNQVAGNAKDGAQWLFTYLGKSMIRHL
jgi:hypothetical protein